MAEPSPLIPGLEGFDPRRRMPFPENFPGTTGEISTERDIYIGIIPVSDSNWPRQCRERLVDLTPEQQLWEEAQGLMTARQLMREGKAVFWGCPQGTFAFVVGEDRCQKAERYSRHFSARMEVAGKICITRSGNVGLVCLSSDGFSHPVVSGAPSSYDDTPLAVEAGSYVVTVTQMFRWRKSQFAQTNPEFLHYHIEFRSMPGDSTPLMTEIPWLRLTLPT
jgi:hypothetical protein